MTQRTYANPALSPALQKFEEQIGEESAASASTAAKLASVNGVQIWTQPPCSLAP